MPFTTGDTVGSYRIAEELGHGGMATVYKAYHAGLDRHVAIKVLHPDLKEDPTFIARFQREARLVAKLDHPNIVPVHDFAEHAGHPYLVMKFIEGETLKQRLQRGPLTSAEINAVVDSVGSALAYAHQQGILHRDVKPSNVLVTTAGHIYLADFGLARITQPGETTLTADAIIGTPQYISPEQAVGRKDLDEGTDIYSFGVMLYELVVGRVPFNADTPFSIIFDHIYTPLPMPRSINPAVPESVEQVLVKALAKERPGRYATILEMAAAFKEAWKTAGVPMQGTAIILPDQRLLPPKETPQVVKAPPAGPEGAESHIPEPPKAEPPAPASRQRPKKAKPFQALWVKRSIWMFVAGGALLAAGCVGTVMALNILNQYPGFRKSLGLGQPPAVTTAAPLPTEFTFCSGEQTWLTRSYFPEQEIQHCWEREHYITELVFTGSEWVFVMTKEVPFTDQAYLTGTDFPEQKIQEYWERGFEITNTYHGNGEWVVVMTQGTNLNTQHYLSGGKFPDEKVRNSWEKDSWITSIGYGDGNWVVVMSGVPSVSDQVYFLRTAFPEEEVKRYWADGYDITTLTYVNSLWAFAMSKGDVFSDQHYLRNGDFPGDAVRNDWGDDFFITNLAYGDSNWAVVMSKP